MDFKNLSQDHKTLQNYQIFLVMDYNRISDHGSGGKRARCRGGGCGVQDF